MPISSHTANKRSRDDFAKSDGINCEKQNIRPAMKLRITEFRKLRGLTVEALADQAGMSKSYLSEVANGKKQANARVLETLARALKCAPTDLIDDKSLSPDLLDHIRLLKELSDDDRQSVLRHARGLAKPE